VLAAIVPALTTEPVFKKLRRSTDVRGDRDGFFDIQTFLRANDFGRWAAPSITAVFTDGASDDKPPHGAV
jgi:hypothetical protein